MFRYDARGECPVQWKKREKVTLFYLGSDPPPQALLQAQWETKCYSKESYKPKPMQTQGSHAEVLSPLHTRSLILPPPLSFCLLPSQQWSGASSFEVLTQSGNLENFLKGVSLDSMIRE